MSTVFDVTKIEVYEADAGVGTVNAVPTVVITNEPVVDVIKINVPGIQGPPGLKNVFIQQTDPSTEDPDHPWGMAEKDFIWIGY